MAKARVCVRAPLFLIGVRDATPASASLYSCVAVPIHRDLVPAPIFIRGKSHFGPENPPLAACRTNRCASLGFVKGAPLTRCGPLG